jgi:class 3 adenylate cyclase
LEAVVGGLGYPTVDLMAWAFAAPAAIGFAVRQPARVRRLVLVHAASRGRDFRAPSEFRDLRSLRESNWELYLQTSALLSFGWTEVGRRWAERLSSDMSKESIRKGFEEFHNSDVSELLPLVRCPALVMHLREGAISMEATRELAAAIPNARFVTVSQKGRTAWSGDWESTFAPVTAFLDEGSETEEPQLPEGTALILFADIVDSTALTESLGDAAFREKAREVAAALRSIIAKNGGRTIEGPTLGDGVLATFTSARQAIEAALACGRAGDDGGLPLHLGLHAGDVTREKDPGGRSNVYGGAVNIASRISGLSAPGEVLVSDTVRSLARTSAGVAFEDRGEQSLKGVADPVRLFAVN